jgi:hypothetical protein
MSDESGRKDRQVEGLQDDSAKFLRITAHVRPQDHRRRGKVGHPAQHASAKSGGGIGNRSDAQPAHLPAERICVTTEQRIGSGAATGGGMAKSDSRTAVSAVPKPVRPLTKPPAKAPARMMMI